jgi:hypothetical protein
MCDAAGKRRQRKWLVFYIAQFTREKKVMQAGMHAALLLQNTMLCCARATAAAYPTCREPLVDERKCTKTLGNLPQSHPAASESKL